MTAKAKTLKNCEEELAVYKKLKDKKVTPLDEKIISRLANLGFAAIVITEWFFSARTWVTIVAGYAMGVPVPLSLLLTLPIKLVPFTFLPIYKAAKYIFKLPFRMARGIGVAAMSVLPLPLNYSGNNYTEEQLLAMPEDKVDLILKNMRKVNDNPKLHAAFLRCKDSDWDWEDLECYQDAQEGTKRRRNLPKAPRRKSSSRPSKRRLPKQPKH